MDTMNIDDVEKEDILYELISKDGKTFNVKRDIAFMNKMIRDMADDLTDIRSVNTQISSSLLRKILEYCDHYEGNPPSRDCYDEGELCDWDHQFVESMSPKELLEVLCASHFLQNTSLLLCCQNAVANSCKGLQSDEIKIVCCVPSNTKITNEEEEEIRAHIKF
jgi:hypothetical protein